MTLLITDETPPPKLNVFTSCDLPTFKDYGLPFCSSMKKVKQAGVIQVFPTLDAPIKEALEEFVEFHNTSFLGYEEKDGIMISFVDPEYYFGLLKKLIIKDEQSFYETVKYLSLFQIRTLSNWLLTDIRFPLPEIPILDPKCDFAVYIDHDLTLSCPLAITPKAEDFMTYLYDYFFQTDLVIGVAGEAVRVASKNINPSRIQTINISDL